MNREKMESITHYENEEEISYFTIALLLIGIASIFRLLWKEFMLALSKKQKLSEYAANHRKKVAVKKRCEVTTGSSEEKSSNSPPLKTKRSGNVNRLYIPTWSEIFLYRVDSYFSKSRWAKGSVLLMGTFLLIFSGGGMLRIFSNDNLSLYQSTWLAWTYIADPGTHADAEGLSNRVIAVIITLGGMLIFALVIGLVSDEIGRCVDILNKGTSRCIEDDHTLMLGWTDKSLAIIQELALANESEGGGVIVVLAEAGKQEMEATLLSALQMNEHPLELHGTEVIFRSGNPLMENQLHKVSVLTSRAIIALSPDGVSPDEADSRMVRQVLCLKAFKDDLNSHVVVEMQDIDNKELVELVAPDIAEVIVAHDMIGRLMIQCTREPELSAILENLLGFDGAEFYFEKWKAVVGKTFGEITCRFDDAVPVGVKVGATNSVLINPKNSYRIKPDDALLFLAEDNDSYSVNDGTYQQKFNDIDKIASEVCNFQGFNKRPRLEKEKLLFCGWRRDMYDMIMQLERCVAAGSELWLFNTVPAQERIEMLSDNGNKDELELKQLSIKNVVGNPLVRRDLRRLVAVDDQGQPIKGETITLDCFNSILILADDIAIENGAEMQSSDSQSLVTLLFIQDIQKRLFEKNQLLQGTNKRSKKPMTQEDINPYKKLCNPISEILDTRTRGLLQVANCKGYVMSNIIVSSVIAQIAEDRDMNLVLGELLSGKGSELFLGDISAYLSEEELQLSKNDEEDKNNDTKKRKFSFWEISLRARLKRQVILGYKPKNATTTLDANDTILNPPNKHVPLSWEKGDKLVVLLRHNHLEGGKIFESSKDSFHSTVTTPEQRLFEFRESSRSFEDDIGDISLDEKSSNDDDDDIPSSSLISNRHPNNNSGNLMKRERASSLRD